MPPPPSGNRTCVGGGGLAPSPSLPDRPGGWGITGAWRPRKQHPDWLTRVTWQPPLSPLLHGCQFFEGSWGSHKGPRELHDLSLFTETQSALILLLFLIPGFLSRCQRPCPPHSPLRTGSAWLPQPRNVHCAGARVRPIGGGEGARESSSAQASGQAPQLPRRLRERARWVGRKWGRKLGAERRPLSSTALSLNARVPRGGPRRPDSVPFL